MPGGPSLTCVIAWRQLPNTLHRCLLSQSHAGGPGRGGWHAPLSSLPAGTTTSWHLAPGPGGPCGPVTAPNSVFGLCPRATKVLVYLQHLIPRGAGQVPMFALAQRMSCQHCPGQADHVICRRSTAVPPQHSVGGGQCAGAGWEGPAGCWWPLPVPDALL